MDINRKHAKLVTVLYTFLKSGVYLSFPSGPAGLRGKLKYTRFLKMYTETVPRAACLRIYKYLRDFDRDCRQRGGLPAFL